MTNTLSTQFSIPPEPQPNSVEHTPTPWKLVWRTPPFVQFSGWSIKQDDDIEFPIAFVTQTRGGLRPPSRADAEFIVRAANAHDELLTMLRALLNQIDYVTTHNAKLTDEIGGLVGYGLIAMAHETIARAEGRTP